MKIKGIVNNGVQWNEYCCAGGPHHFPINSNVCFTADDWTVFETVITLVQSSLMAILPFSKVTAPLFFVSITGQPDTTHTGYAPPSGDIRFDGYSLLWSKGKLYEPTNAKYQVQVRACEGDYIILYN